MFEAKVLQQSIMRWPACFTLRQTEHDVNEDTSPSTYFGKPIALLIHIIVRRYSTFKEFSQKPEEDCQSGFEAPKKKKKGSHSKSKTSWGSTNVEIKIALAAQTDEVIKLCPCKTQIIKVDSLANKKEIPVNVESV